MYDVEDDTMSCVWRPAEMSAIPPGANGVVPVSAVVIHPGVERVRVHRRGDAWKLRPFTACGFQTLQPFPDLSHNPEVKALVIPTAARATECQVDVTLDGYFNWTISINSKGIHRLHQHGGLVVIVTHDIRPSAFNTLDQLNEALLKVMRRGTGDVAWATAAPPRSPTSVDASQRERTVRHWWRWPLKRR